MEPQIKAIFQTRNMSKQQLWFFTSQTFIPNVSEASTWRLKNLSPSSGQWTNLSWGTLTKWEKLLLSPPSPHKNPKQNKSNVSRTEYVKTFGCFFSLYKTCQGEKQKLETWKTYSIHNLHDQANDTQEIRNIASKMRF
jgi:hypothetical protein